MVGQSRKGGAWTWRQMALGAACLAGLAGAGYVGSLFLPRAAAQPAAAPKATPAPSQPAVAAPTPASDYSQRPVAFLHKNEAITREQLGEYLIARYGAEKLPLLINKIIIEEACRAKGIDATPAEVEAEFAQELATMKLDQKQFVDGILKQYKQTLYEWKEDVVRPKLLMTKLVHDRVTVTENDVKAGYDAYYGEKIDCNVIYWPQAERQRAIEEYSKIRDSEEEFQRKARTQANSRLAATAGHMEPPIARHTTGSDAVEDAAFRLQPGEVSPLVDTADGVVVIKCIKRIPPDTTKSIESVRATIYKEVFDKKIAMEIPKVFAELQKQAEVNSLLEDPNKPENLTESVKQSLGQAPGKDGVPAADSH
jgi:hypothetical protein